MAQDTRCTRRVGIFARLPVPGKVKSRLAAAIGPESAAEAYRWFAEHCFSETSRCPDTSVTLFNSVAEEVEACKGWLASVGLPHIQVAAQVESMDLGDRMAAAMASMLADGASKVVIIGTDIPDISTEILSAAFAALDNHEMILGPACDGGYYLIGVTKLPEGVLQGIEWSTSKVYRATEANAEKAGLRVAPDSTLPRLRDIDYIEDLVLWYDSTSPTLCAAEHPLRGQVQQVVEAHR